MMTTRTALSTACRLGAVLLVCGLGVDRAEAGPRLYARLGAGIASPSLDDWNEDIQIDEDANRANGGNIDIEQMGVGFPVLGEIGIRVADALAMGMLASWQSRSVDNPLNNSIESLVYQREVSAVTLAGAFDIVIASGDEEGWGGALMVDRLVVGGDAGWAWSDARYEVHYRRYSDPSFDVDIDGSWEGQVFTASLYVGVERLLSKQTTLFARLGYRHQNFGELEGGYTSPQWGTLPGPPRFGNGTGEPMETDLSGIYVLAGIGFGG